MGNLAALILAVAVAGCGSKLPNTFGAGPRVPHKPVRLEGKLDLTDKSTLDLSQLNEPFVLMFVTYFCLSCKEEAANLAAHFALKGALPANVRLITVLAGGDGARAERWAQINKVSWSMAADFDASHFQRLCPEQLTPCVLTQNLASATPVTKHIGLVPIDQLEKETGPWQF